jgi:hypothetical protein
MQFDHRLFVRNSDQNISQEAEARTPDRFCEGKDWLALAVKLSRT